METIVRGQKAVAEHFRVSERTVRNWIKAGMPKLSGGRYDLFQIRTWLDQRQGISPATGPRVQPDDPRQGVLGQQRGKDFEDARLKKAKADLAEMDLRWRRGELVERNEVEQIFAARAAAYKQSMLGFARALPPLLVNRNEREMEAIITRKVREALENICRPLPGKFGSNQKVGEESQNPPARTGLVSG